MVYLPKAKTEIKLTEEYIRDLEDRLNKAFRELDTISHITIKRARLIECDLINCNISGGVGGGGIRKLSELEIDVDKDWLGHGIENAEYFSVSRDYVDGILRKDEYTNGVALNLKYSRTIPHITASAGMDAMTWWEEIGGEEQYAGLCDVIIGAGKVKGSTHYNSGFLFTCNTAVGSSMGIFCEDAGITKMIQINAKFGERLNIQTDSFDIIPIAIAEPPEIRLKSRGMNIFRIEDFEDAETHIVDSIYEDSLARVVGTRWAKLIGDFDYHIGIGITQFKGAVPSTMMGVVGNSEYGLFTPLPYNARQGINISVNPNNYKVEHIDIRLNSETGGYLSIIDDTADIPGYDGGYPSIETKHMLFSTNLYSDDVVGMFLSQPPYQDTSWQYLWAGISKTGGFISLSDGITFIGIDLLESVDDGYALLHMHCGSVAPSSILAVCDVFGSKISLSSEYGDLYIETGYGGASIHGNLYLDMHALYGVILPQVYSPKEPNMVEGEVKLWKDTATNTYWLLWNVDGQIRRVQLT